MREAEVLRHRSEKDRFFKLHQSSPLTEAQRAAFDSLIYYPYAAALDLTVQVSLHDHTDVAQVFTTKDMIRNYQRYGDFSLTVAGQVVSLTIYETQHGFFLPFVDASAGTETYPAGRYLDPVQLDETTFHVDFNLAYNPFCAYNEKFDCPITPAENRLQVAIQAGEKLPTGRWLSVR